MSSPSSSSRSLSPTSTSSKRKNSPSNRLQSQASNDSGCFPTSNNASGATLSSGKSGIISSVLQTEISFTQDQLQSTEYVRYGDSIKLFATSVYLKNDMKEKGQMISSNQLGGYIGVYEKPDGTTRLAIPPIGDNAEGTFKESVLRVQSPHEDIEDGKEVRYGEWVVLVDENGLVWNNKCGTGTFSGFFEGYLGPRPRGTNGELYVSFQKNGHDRRPVIYGENAVYIDVETSHRYRSSYNYRLTNYRSSNSRVVGGYISSDGTGHELPFMIHRHSGPPIQAYKNPAIEKKLSNRAGSMSNGSMFVPPKIKYVAIQRKKSGDGSKTQQQDTDEYFLDTMMKDPLYGKPIKLYTVRPEDSILIALDQENEIAKISADHLFSAAENAAATSMSPAGPLQLDIAINKKPGTAAAAAAAAPISPSRKRNAAGNRILELNSVEMLVEQDITVLKRAFQDDNRSYSVDENAADDIDFGGNTEEKKLGKLDLLIACHKLAMVYFAFAVVIPYFVWHIIIVIGELIEPIHQLSESNKTLQLVERIATTLVHDFGIEVVDGKAIIDDEVRNRETTTATSAMIAFLVSYAMGLITPSFARRGSLGNGSSKGLGSSASDDVDSANWLISIQVPEDAWDISISAPSLMSGVSTRTQWDEDSDGDGSAGEDDGASDPDGMFKVNGVRLGGSFGDAGVDEKGVPKHPAFKRFLAGEKGNMEAAKQRWIRTCEWRVEGNIDDILDQPHPYFDVIKKNVPNYFYGRAKNGFPVYIDCPGGVNMKALRKAGVKLSDLLFHYTYATEFQWKMIEPSEEGRTVSILDLSGVGMFDFVGEVIDFVKKTIALSGEHYPERAHRIFILNAPRYFTGIWGIVKPWLDDETRKKIGLFRNNYKDTLLEEIDIDVLPVKYGGNNQTPLGQTMEDKMMESHVCKVLLANNRPMFGDDGEPIPDSLESMKSRVDDTLETGVSKINWDVLNAQRNAK